MPEVTDPAAARQIVADGATYVGNLNITTVAAAFEAAQFAVVMLGTNDVVASRSSGDFIDDFVAIVNVLESRNIGVVISTIPPHYQSRQRRPGARLQRRTLVGLLPNVVCRSSTSTPRFSNASQRTLGTGPCSTSRMSTLHQRWGGTRRQAILMIPKELPWSTARVSLPTLLDTYCGVG